MSSLLLVIYTFIGFIVMSLYVVYLRKYRKRILEEDDALFAIAVGLAWPLTTFVLVFVALAYLIQKVGNKL